VDKWALLGGHGIRSVLNLKVLQERAVDCSKKELGPCFTEGGKWSTCSTWKTVRRKVPRESAQDARRYVK